MHNPRQEHQLTLTLPMSNSECWPHCVEVSEDALDHSVSIHDLEQGSPDILASLGFGPATGCDVAMNHTGMLAAGLQMELEFNNYDHL